MNRTEESDPTEMQLLTHNIPRDPNAPSEAASEPQKSYFMDWPASSNTLKSYSPSTFIRLLPNVLLLLVPSAFYVLGIFILRLNGQLESPGRDAGDTVIQAVKVASTLWPILYAAVVGSMLKAITLFYAERGTSLGTLEVLTTSQTLVSTVRGCFSHRIFRIWTAVLIILWSLSPAGGQAVLRSVEPAIHKQSHDFDLKFYPSTSIWSLLRFSPFIGASSAQSARKDVHRVVDATISSPDAAVLFSKGLSSGFDSAITRLGGELQAAESSRMDLWGNVRIPFLHLLPGYTDDDRSKWVEVSQTDIAPYSSLIGHTIRKVPLSSIGNFSTSLQTIYHTLSCTSFFNGTEWLQRNPGRLRMHQWTNYSIFSEIVESGTNGNIFLDILLPENQTESMLPEPKPWENPTNKVEKAVVVFGVRGDLNELFKEINMTHCETTAIYVDTEVKCVRAAVGGKLSCAALRMRETPGMPPSNWSAVNWGVTAGAFLYEVPNTIQSSHINEVSGLELYLKDPPTSFSGFDIGDYTAIPLDTFQARLALIVNSFYHATLNTSNFVGVDGINGTDNRVDSYLPGTPSLQHGNATGTWTEFTPSRYEVKPGWLTLYLVSTTVLAVCAIASVAFSALTRAPDLFCGVSSLTRDSAFMTRVPDGGSSLSASDRARHLQDVWVRIQDVKPEDDVGRIALSDQKELGAAAGLRWERKYE